MNQKKFKSKIDEIMERLAASGKAVELCDEQVKEIDNHLSSIMSQYRQELRIKQSQSEEDLRKIILNA